MGHETGSIMRDETRELRDYEVKRTNPAPLPDDPWAHRSSGMRCTTCMWFVAKPNYEPITSARGNLGRCRRHAPTMSGYPAVFATDWCGDHKLDEAKL